MTKRRKPAPKVTVFDSFYYEIYKIKMHGDKAFIGGLQRLKGRRMGNNWGFYKGGNSLKFDCRIV